MGYQVRARRFGKFGFRESRILWRLRRPFTWSWPPGWGWEGPDEQGSAMTAWGARRGLRRAEQRADQPGGSE